MNARKLIESREPVDKIVKSNVTSESAPPNAGAYGAVRVILDDDDKETISNQGELKALLRAGKITIDGNELWVYKSDKATQRTLDRFINVELDESRSPASSVNEGSNGYYRLPKNVVSSTLYPIRNELQNFYDMLSQGHDFDYNRWVVLTTKMKAISDKAKFFKTGEKPTGDFEY